MSRPLRLHVPGLLHHVFARGNNKARLFEDDVDYEAFLRRLGSVLNRFRVRCVAYCLLSNHYHLLLIPTEHRISRLMQHLNSAYCQRFNRRHNRVGHLLQGRFGCRIVEDGAYARTVLRYLALNPVAAGIATDPEAWPWSSYRFAQGLEEPPDFLSIQDVWAAFDTSDCLLGRVRFSQFVGAGLPEVFTNPVFYGSEQLAERLAADLEPHRTTRDYVYAARFAARPSLASLLDGRVDRVAVEDAAHEAFHRHAYTLAEIGGIVKRDPSVLCRWIQRAQRRQPPSLVPSFPLDRSQATESAPSE